VDDKPYLSLWAGDSAADTIAQILKRVERSDLRTVEQDGVVATIGLPDRYHRPRPDWIGVAVNGRYVNCPPLLQVIQSAFHRTLPRDRHPLCLIQLRVSPEEVDWNRHPAKQELYLQKVTDYQVAVQTAIEAALADCEPIATKRSRQFLLDNRRCQDSPPDTAISKPTTLLEEPNRYTTAPLTPIKVLAQVQNTYILVEHANGLWLVEQHVAHERIRYEQLLEEWQFVSLPEPLLLKDLSDRQVERLETLQLSPTPFGDNLWAIRHMPQMLQDVPDLAVALRDLSNCTDLDAARVAIACRTAIRNGTPLSPAEMQIVIDRWRVTGNPHTCPHGRPIYLTLTETDLARFFRRHWNLCSRGWGEGPIGDRFSADIRQASSR
jgi:DNA mismatch repair protein MutL